jgi:hypothetical protein
MDTQPKIKARLERLAAPSLPPGERLCLAVGAKSSEHVENTILRHPKMYLLALTETSVFLLELGDKPLAVAAVYPLGAVPIGAVQQKWWSIWTDFKLQLPSQAEPISFKTERTSRADLEYIVAQALTGLAPASPTI